VARVSTKNRKLSATRTKNKAATRRMAFAFRRMFGFWFLVYSFWLPGLVDRTINQKLETRNRLLHIEKLMRDIFQHPGVSCARQNEHRRTGLVSTLGLDL